MLAYKDWWFGADKQIMQTKSALKICRMEGSIIEESSSIK